MVRNHKISIQYTQNLVVTSHLKEAAVQQVAQHMSTLTACKTTKLQQHLAHESFTCGELSGLKSPSHQVAQDTDWQTCSLQP